MGYEINDCGVCTNPTYHCETKLNKNTCLSCYISTAQFPNGQWSYGYSIECDDMSKGASSSCGCSLSFGRGWKTQKEAIMAAVVYLRTVVLHHQEYYKAPYKKSLEMIDRCQKEFFEPVQLSLF